MKRPLPTYLVSKLVAVSRVGLLLADYWFVVLKEASFPAGDPRARIWPLT